MIEISDSDFESVLAESIDELPVFYAEKMNNVAIVWADKPTESQRKELKLRGN